MPGVWTDGIVWVVTNAPDMDFPHTVDVYTTREKAEKHVENYLERDFSDYTFDKEVFTERTTYTGPETFHFIVIQAFVTDPPFSSEKVLQ